MNWELTRKLFLLFPIIIILCVFVFLDYNLKNNFCLAGHANILFCGSYSQVKDYIKNTDCETSELRRSCMIINSQGYYENISDGMMCRTEQNSTECEKIWIETDKETIKRMSDHINNYYFENIKNMFIQNEKIP